MSWFEGCSFTGLKGGKSFPEKFPSTIPLSAVRLFLLRFLVSASFMPRILGSVEKQVRVIYSRVGLNKGRVHSLYMRRGKNERGSRGGLLKSRTFRRKKKGRLDIQFIIQQYSGMSSNKFLYASFKQYLRRAVKCTFVTVNLVSRRLVINRFCLEIDWYLLTIDDSTFFLQTEYPFLDDVGAELERFHFVLASRLVCGQFLTY